MMKKITLLLMLLVASISLQAQTWDFTTGKNGWVKIGDKVKFSAETDGVKLEWTDGTNNVGMKNKNTGITDAAAKPIFAITTKISGSTNISKIKLVYIKDDGSKNKTFKATLKHALTNDFVTYYIDLTGKDFSGAKPELSVIFLDGNNVPSGVDDIIVQKIEFLESIPTTEQHVFTFDTDGDQEGFEGKNVNSISVAGGILTIDPKEDKYTNIQQVEHHLDATTYGTLEIELKNNSTDDDTLYFVFPDGTTKELTITTGDTAFKTYKMDLMGNTSWTGEVTGYKIRFGDASRPNPTDATKFGVSSGTGTIEIDKISFTSEVMAVDDVDFVDDAKISLYPNPTRDILSIQAPKPIEKIEIYNMLGQKAMSKTDSLKTLNISRLEKGIYVLKIFQEGNIVSSKRFIKQ